MKYYNKNSYILPYNAKFVKVERNKLDPLEGCSFVSIAYYDIGGEVVGLVF